MLLPIKTFSRNSWVGPYVRKYKKLLALAIVLSALTFVFGAGLMFTSGFMISLAAAIPLTVLAIHLPSIFVRIFGIGRPLLHYAERVTSHDWALRMTSEMRRRLYEVIAKKSHALQNESSPGSILALLTEDIGHVQDLFLRSVLPLVTSWIVAVLMVIATGIFSWQLGFFMLIFLVVLVVVMPLVSVSVNGARLQVVEQASHQLYDQITDDVYGATDWKLSGRTEECVHKTLQLRKRARECENKIRGFRRWHDCVAQALFGVCVVIMLVWASLIFGNLDGSFANDLASNLANGGAFGAAAAIGNSGSANAPAWAPNWIAAFVLCVLPLMEAFAPASSAALEAEQQKSAIERLQTFAESAPASATSEKETEQSPSIPETFDIRIENASFSYSESAPYVLHNITLSIPHGQTVALTGRSGIGKTTLAQLIHGDISPTSGSVSIGDVSATKLSARMHEYVGIIQQKPYLFDTTLRKNLELAKPNATDEEFLQALGKAELGELLESLPDGLNTQVGEHGVRFSGGERQRIALARILLSDTPIVVLDEPFTGLDEATAEKLLATILSTLKGKTIIAITHNESVLPQFDRVIHLQNNDAGAEAISI